MRKILLTVAACLGVIASFAQLSGNYTIDAATSTGGTNYQTWGAAVGALTSSGVSGPVTFNVKQATYTEQVNIGAITGASATNTITFQADPSNTAEAKLTFSSGHVIRFNGTNNITFDGLVFEATGSFMKCIDLNGGSNSDITFENNEIIGAPTTSTFNGYATIYDYWNYQQNGIVIKNNEISRGSMGIVFYSSSSSTTTSDNFTIDSNDIVDFHYMGIYNYRSGSAMIRGNLIQNNPTGYTYPYAWYSFYGQQEGSSFEFIGNQIELDAGSGGYGCYIYQHSGSSSSPSVFANNFITYPDDTDPYTVYGMRFYYSSNLRVVHNNVNVGSAYNNVYGCYIYSNSSAYTNCEFKNNIINNKGTSGYVMYLYDAGGTWDVDYNNYYHKSSGFYNYYNGIITEFSAWQTNAGADANGYNTDPLFYSNTDLHVQSATLNQVGDSVGIMTDIDGETRPASNPDIGADEFVVPHNNAQPVALLNPVPPLCADDSSIVAVILNSGIVTLDSVTVNYTVGGGAPMSMSWTGSLAPQAMDTVTLVSSLTISNGDEVKVWTSMPNGVPDSSALFDTVAVDMFDGMIGTYTVPGDYATLTLAAEDLALKGVCDDVIISIAPGSYNEQVVLGEIVGASADATVTFTSSTGNASDVNINFTSNNFNENYVVSLNGADWVRFKDVKINATGTFYSRVVFMDNGADNNIIEDCILDGPSNYNSTSTYAANIYSQGNNAGNTIKNNLIHHGSYGIYIAGVNTTALFDGITIEGNTHDDIYYMDCRVNYGNNVMIKGNTITKDTAIYNFAYGIYLYYSDNFDIIGNYVGMNANNGYAYPMYIYRCNGRQTPRSQVANNCVQAGAPGSTIYGYYGMYTYLSGVFDIVNNSVTRAGGYQTSQVYSCLYLNQGGLVRVKNNNFANFNQTSAMYAPSPYVVTESDNNNFYSNSTSFPLIYLSSGYNDLAAYQAGTGFDMNSVSVNPAYTDTLGCITCNDTLDAAGTPDAGVLTDIAGNVRSTTTPDIGASEFIAAGSFTLGSGGTVCGSETSIEAGPAQSVLWTVVTSSGTTTSTDPILNLSTGCDPTAFNVSVNILTENCGSASDQVNMTLVPDATLDDSTHICADETVTLDPCGGASATYTWGPVAAFTPTLDVDAGGMYTIEKDEMGCVSMDTIYITESEAVQIADVEECSANLPVTIDATIADGISYAWDGGSSANSAQNTFSDQGVYNITATDIFGCSSSDQFTLTVLEVPVASILESHNGVAYVFDASNSLYISGNTTFFWDFGNGTTSNQMIDTVFYPYAVAPNLVTYPVSLTVTNECGEHIETSSVTPDPTGISDVDGSSFAIYPNPTDEFFNIVLNNASSDVTVIELIDLSGRSVAMRTLPAGSSNGMVNVSALASGTYLVKVSTDTDVSFTKLTVK